MSTLVVVEEVLKESGAPMVVRDIVIAAGERLPTKSRTPATVVARDLAMNIKKHGVASRFVRVAPGLYALREHAHETDVIVQAIEPAADDVALAAPLDLGVLPESAPETGADA
jgi:HB1, ASXL, restriction endonuclease HTH domain